MAEGVREPVDLEQFQQSRGHADNFNARPRCTGPANKDDHRGDHRGVHSLHCRQVDDHMTGPRAEDRLNRTNQSVNRLIAVSGPCAHRRTDDGGAVVPAVGHRYGVVACRFLLVDRDVREPVERGEASEPLPPGPRREPGQGRPDAGRTAAFCTCAAA